MAFIPIALLSRTPQMLVKFSTCFINQIDYLICDSTEFEVEYFKTLNNEYQSTRFIYKFENNNLLLYLDKNDSNFASFKAFKLSNTSQKLLDNFFSEPIAIFTRTN